MQAIFIETCIQSETSVPHAQIECVGVPDDDHFDFELFFKKSLSWKTMLIGVTTNR